MKAQKTSKILRENEYLRQLVALLVDHYNPEKIYLIGSQARGDQRPDSDYDVVVVVPKKVSWIKRKAFYKAKGEARLAEPTDILFVSAKTFEEQRELKSSLPATVLEEGKLLYAAA